ncbi:MAG: hypothetical protein QOI31_2790 [Solirubrobacterales bacterium]|nr:hypothetical protein [Solirubrobacterales bacterium]
MDELATKLRAAVEPLLSEGEEIRGVCMASQVGMVKGRAVALATTSERLIVQGLDRKLVAKDEPILLTHADIERASADGAGGGWAELTAAVMDSVAVKLDLRTTSGEKLKLMLMSGTGPLGGLGGGETQRQGVEALSAFFASAP